MLSRSLTWARDWGGRRLSSIRNWSALGWSPPLARVLRSSRDQSGESESLRFLRPDKHILLTFFATCFCWQMWLGGVNVDRCCYNSILCWDILCSVCCSSDGRSTTDDDHWAVGVTLRWPAPAVTGDSCSANTDPWLAGSDQVTEIQGSHWPLLASYGLYTQLVSYWRRLLFIKLPSDWLLVIIWGLWLAEGNKGTSAIWETAACSDRGLCGDGLHLHPFYKYVNEILHFNHWTNGLIIKI